MQTFLPYQDFDRCAAVLDRHRLGKQRTEALEILVILNGEQPEWMSDAWYARCLRHQRHPAVRMWSEYTEALVEYGVTVCDCWVGRGYRDRLRPRIVDYSWGGEVILPPWLGRTLCRSHQSNLVRKNPAHYRPHFPLVPDDLPYHWPSSRSNR